MTRRRRSTRTWDFEQALNDLDAARDRVSGAGKV